MNLKLYRSKEETVEDRHKNAMRHNDEMVFLNENRKHMNNGEERRFLAYVRKELEIGIKVHELYIVVKDRVERCGQ